MLDTSVVQIMSHSTETKIQFLVSDEKKGDWIEKSDRILGLMIIFGYFKMCFLLILSSSTPISSGLPVTFFRAFNLRFCCRKY
jgi:hypothetical protein